MKRYKRVVVKIGTKVITSKYGSLDSKRLKEIAYEISNAEAKGIEFIIVSSGAIGAGMGLLGLRRRPIHLSDLQAAASIGQSHLMHVYSESFRARGYLVGQILLTQEDFNDRKRYLNIKYTIERLLKDKAIPIINENDTVSTDEIRCGDNDRLASLVSDLIEADLLILLTDVDGLLDEKGEVLNRVEALDQRILRLARAARSELGTGGMSTKLAAILRATQSGTRCVVANGKKEGVISKIIAQDKVGTLFENVGVKIIARKRWIAFSSKPKGAIVVDGGAREALSKKDKSLLASGIIDVTGNFVSGDIVKISDTESKEFARGVVNYSSSEITKIKGAKTSEIAGILGYKKKDEVIHKDNLVIL